MAWIASQTSMEKNKKLRGFRKAMRWSKNEAVGFLHRFWWTVMECAPNGDISSLSADDFAEPLDMPEDQVVAAMKVMEQERLLCRRDGRLLVNDWIEHAGTYLRHSLYRRSPEKWKMACEVHGVSFDCQSSVDGQSVVPSLPNQQTYKSASKKAGEVALAHLRKVGKT